jgi:hypothetical protein
VTAPQPAAGSPDHFPFGQPSTARPPRRPDGRARLLVLGTYPSALHVRWRVPQWAVADLGLRAAVGALAVDVEPTVFWDGGSAAEQDELVGAWKDAVGFVDGDDRDCDGHVAPAGNGTSGRAVVDDVLHPLGVAADDTWFTDALVHFHVKHGGGAQQGDRIAQVYAPFAEARGRSPARLPPRPSPSELVRRASTQERPRLLAELAEADAPVIVTLGEEARQVLASIADEGEGPPTRPLSPDTHGRPGRIDAAGVQRTWIALTHPGNRSPRWAEARARFRGSGAE